MQYNRTYTLSEVERILDTSEHRPRPNKPPGTGVHGHALSLHTSEHRCLLFRPGHYPAKDAIFLVSRHSMAAIVHEALNSPSGQRKLEQLNQPSKSSVRIRTVILRRGKGFDIFTVYRPREIGSQMSFDWLSTTKGDGFIVQVFVLVVKVPGSSTGEIHIQTAFPEQYARTIGEDIVGLRV